MHNHVSDGFWMPGLLTTAGVHPAFLAATASLLPMLRLIQRGHVLKIA
jgi:hypothetical protein